MNKTSFSTPLFFSLAVGIILFHSCIKEKGPMPSSMALYNFHFVEGFESSANLPSSWTLNNPANDATWQVITTVARSGTNCIGFNNYNGNGSSDMTARKDRFITRSFDLSKATFASISFDLAYAALNFKNHTYTDSLAVFSSIDGGFTWDQIYLKGGNTLTSVPTITSAQSCWTPSSATDWRTDNIIVNNLAGHSSVKFAFENISDWGEWIYIDNISITASNSKGNSCDNITYANSIQPLMQSQCAISGCHVWGGSGPSDFTTYAGVKAEADNGNLKKRLIDGNPGFMPLTGKLADSTLTKIQCWLDAGSPNN